MLEYLAIKRVAKLEGVSARAVRQRLAAGQYSQVKWQRSRGGKQGKRALIHWSELRPEARDLFLAEEQARSSKAVSPGLRAYIEAPSWAKQRADDRQALLQLLDRQVDQARRHEPELVATGALRLILQGYNGGTLAPELRGRLRHVSLRSVYEWRKRAEGNLGSLLPSHGGGRRPKATDEIKAAIGRILLQKILPARQVYRMLKARFGRDLPAYRTILRACQEYVQEHQRELTLAQAPTAYKRRLLPSLGRADRAATGPNSLWEIDSTRADLIFKDGRRRIGISVEDVFSRRVVIGLHEKDNVWAVAQTLRKALLTMHLPDAIKMDNGLNYYQSTHVQRVCAELGIEVIKLPPYAPEKKPHVERIFGTWQPQVLQPLDGYTGPRVAARPEIILPRHTPEEIQKRTDQWLSGVYEEEVHSVTKQRPRERFNQPGFRPRMIADERELDLLLMPAGLRTVQAATIKWDSGTYYAPELAAFEGQEVELRIPDDASQVIVYSAERPGAPSRFICYAVDPARKGWTPADIATEKARLRKRDRLLLEAERERLKPAPLYQQTEQWLEAAAKAKPLSLPMRGEVVNLPRYTETIERLRALAEPAEVGQADEDARPHFADELERYDWVWRRRLDGLSVPEEDAAWAAEFEQSESFRAWGMDAYYGALERQLALRRQAG